MDAMAQVAVAETNHGGGKNENIEQILCQFVANANASINNYLIQNIYHDWGNADISDIAECRVASIGP